MSGNERVERFRVVAVDMQGLRHHAQLITTVEKTDGRYMSVSVSTACLPSMTKAEGLSLIARPFDLPMIRHRDLMLMSYQRLGLATPPATCMTCVSMDHPLGDI